MKQPLSKRHLIIAITSICLAFLLAAGTILVLSRLTDKSDMTSKDQDGDTANLNTDAITTKDGVDPQLNNQALTVEKQAINIIESDPLTAKNKFLEAKETYIKANNPAKAGEMEANAMTAQALEEEASSATN